MRRLFVVDGSVHSQRSLLAKAFAANVAFERFLLRVNVPAKITKCPINDYTRHFVCKLMKIESDLRSPFAPKSRIGTYVRNLYTYDATYVLYIIIRISYVRVGIVLLCSYSYAARTIAAGYGAGIYRLSATRVYTRILRVK